jgi:methanogenic corrinoid protein MtbC1
MQLSHAPAYNLRAVLRETGIAADTLRAWERRYGLPKPERTPGGQRVYSQHDIHLIKWLMARQAEGLSISRAVEQWNMAAASGTDPLASAAVVSRPQLGGVGSGGNLVALRGQWLAACLAYDELAAEQILSQAFALLPPEMVLSALIQKGLQEVGLMWQSGRASVQQEHFVSALAARRLDTMIAAAPPPTRAQSVLLACPPEEWHGLPLLLLNLLLRLRGWPTVYLGANVPLAQLGHTIEMVQPSLVAMAAQQLNTAVQLREAARLLIGRGAQVAYGGRIFNQVPELREQIAGMFLGEDLGGACDQIEVLLEQKPNAAMRNPQILPGSPAADAFRWRRKLVESELEQLFSGGGSPAAEYLTVANYHFGNALEAALELGNVAYLEADLEWINRLLGARGLAEDSLGHYLAAYATILRQVGRPEVAQAADWLENRATAN